MWRKLETPNSEKLIYKNDISSEECVLTQIHKSDMGVFYVFDNPLQMPFQRKYAFELIKQHENLGLSKNEIAESLEKIKELSKSAEDLSHEIFFHAESTLSKLKDSWDYQKTALMTAAAMIIEEGESIDYFTQDTAVAKINKWSTDSTMLAFFLNIAQVRLNSLTSPFMPNSQSASQKEAIGPGIQ